MLTQAKYKPCLPRAESTTSQAQNPPCLYVFQIERVFLQTKATPWNEATPFQVFTSTYPEQKSPKQHAWSAILEKCADTKHACY